MDAEISENFRSCLENLRSDKVTERKLAAETFLRCISDEILVKILDANSSNKSKVDDGRHITWSYLLRVIKKHITMEAEKILTKVQPDVTKTLTNAMIITRNSCVKLFKTMVKVAGQERANAKPPNFFIYIQSVLSNRQTLFLFGQEFSTILRKDVLTSNILSNEMTSAIFIDIFRLYKNFFSNVPSGWQWSAILEVIQKLLNLSKNISLDSDMQDNIFKFFEEVFTNIKNNSLSSYEGLLQVLIDFTQLNILDFRLKVCSLGEKIIPYFVNSWQSMASTSVKVKFVEFFYVQVVVHNPKGQLEKGSTACDIKKWHNDIKLIFDILIKECENYYKSKHSVSWSICSKPEFITLAVEVCNLVFLMKDEIEPDCRSFKRPRSIYSIFVLLDPLMKQTSTREIIPWLQILTGLIYKYHNVIQMDELLKLLNSIMLIQLSTKLVEVRSWLLKCVCSIFSAFVAKDNFKDKSVFDKVFDHTIRMVALNQCHKESHLLLQILLAKKLVRPSSDFHRLYIPGSSNPLSTSSLKTLMCFLTYFPIPSHYPIFSSNHGSQKNCLYQTQIIQWIFSSDDSFKNRFLDDSACVSILAETLAFLCYREGHSVFHYQDKNLSSYSEPENWMIYLEIQNDVLKSTFDFFFNHDDFSLLNSSTVSENLGVVASIKNQVVSSVNNETGVLLDPTQKYSILLYAKQVAFLIILQKLFLKHSIMTEALINSSTLTEHTKNMLQKLGEYFTPLTNDNVSAILEALKAILLSVEYDNESTDSTTLRWLWSVFPENFLDVLTRVITDESNGDKTILPSPRNFSPSSTSTQLNSSFSSSKALDDLMDLDEPSQPPTKNDGSSSNRKGSNQNSKNMNDLSPLSAVKQNALKLLVKLNFSGTLNAESENYCQRLLSYINFDKMNVNESTNVDLMIEFLKYIVDQNCAINDDHLSHIISSIRIIFRKYKTKNEFSVNCLYVLKKCIPHVVPMENESTSRFKNRDTLLKMFKSLWWREKEEFHEISYVCLLIDINSSLLKLDIESKWCDYDSTNNGPLQAPIIDLIRMLKSPRLKVRNLAAFKLGHFLTDMSSSPLLKEKQKNVFDECYTACIFFCADDQNEINNNISPQLSSLFTFLYCSSTASLTCERDSVFALFQIVKKKNVPPEFILKILSQLQGKLGLSSIFPILSLHIIFIVSHWRDLKYELKDFPYQIFGCQMLREFYRNYQKILVSLLFQRGDLGTLDDIALELGKDRKHLVLESVSTILAGIIPWYAGLDENDSSGSNVEKRRKAALSLQTLQDVVSKDALGLKMSENLDEIVTGLLLSLNESPNHNVLKRYGQFLPPPTITNFNSQSIIKSLEYIKTCISGEGSAIEIVAAKDCGIPNILFGMRKRLSKEERKEERFRLILVYHLFLDKALDYFKTSLQHIAPFIVRETTQAMLNELRHIRICKPLKEVEQCIAKSCIMALKTLCSNSTSIEILSNSAADLVPDMIDSVLRLLVDDNVHPEIADLLHLLIIEKGPCLKKTLSIVDELPNEPFLSIVKEKHKKFRTEEETLDEVMQTFLKGCCCRKNSIRQEGLLTLLHEIRKRKHELKGIALFTENGSLLSEHLEESVIHLTICHLLMFSHSSSLEIQQIAAQCLGEIGTINLGSPILPSVGVAKKYAAFSSNDELDIYEALINYLSDERVKVFQAASSVLRNLLSTSDGKRFVSKCLKNGQLKLYQYCFPLMSRSNSAIGTGANDLDSFSDIVNNSELWSPETQTSYDSWISGIVCSILSTGSHKSSLYQELKPLCLVEPNFCEQILPYVISAILKQKNERHKDILSHQISGFISKHCLLKEKNIKHPDSESSILTPENGNSSLFLCKNAIRAILSIIHHLRMRKKEKDLNIWQTEFSLNINYLQMASAAAYCGAYFTTLLYLELWCDEMNRVMKANEDPDFDSQGSSQFMRLQSHDQIETVQTLLLESFKGIGDIDAIQGCSRIIGDSFPLRISLYEQENKWDRVLSVYDAETTQKHSSQSLGVLRALQKRGLTNTFQGYLHGLMINLDEPSTELVEFQSECAWRTNQWNFVVPEMTSTGVHQSLFKALCHLQNKEYEASMKELKIGRQNVLSGIPVIGASFESVKSVYPFLSQLQALSTVETAVRHQSGSFPLDLLLNEWQSTNNVPFSSFDLIEPTLCLQSVIFRQIINRDHRRGGLLLKGLVRTLEKIIKTAREDNHLEIAENALRQLKKEYQDSNENIWHLKLEEARIYWCRGEANVAKQLLKSMLKPLEQQMEENERGQMKFLYAECLMQYGKWQAETSGESTSTILSNYLEKALTLLKSSSNKELRYEGHLAIARYSDTQYQSLKKYRNTTAFQIKVNTISQARDEAQRLREVKDKNTDHVKAMKIMERQCNIDESEITKLDESIKNFRVKALENYLLCLRDTKAHDLRVFRVISIWFENNKDEDINEILKSQVEKLPTYKFLPLIYQLAARMGTQDVGDFNRILIELIKRMCRDHPYHTVPVLLALCNANKDDTSSQPQTSKSKKKVSVTSHIPEKRTAAAHEVIDHMTKFLPTYISQIKKLCEDYIALAYFPTTDLKSFSSYKIPISLSLHRSNYDRVPILTQELQIDCSCKYEKLVCIKNFSSEYYLCTGINAPKRVDCYSSDGKRHLQLLKSQDDLRQDAVMQQVFALVNCFLNKNVESKKSKLHIRTYKVIPLSKRSGVLQWCDGTQPVGLYLVGQNNKSGAHKRYYPKEWDALKCRQHLSKQTTDCSKLELYQQICENFSPVFRYFFLENFPEPAKWYERRLAYSRSVAVNSIVGYILGLGDRHVQNILVDNCTAELILIDFGIAFEQGKILPTPETVPFRLTREIVDGFGICGVEGVFRRSCEKTMEVMRGSQESLLTILEVLLYDPLYMWSISADKAATIQKKTTKEHHVRHENGNDSDHNGKEINKLAERVLLNLQQKLQGVEDNVALSVSGQVGCLIQQAKDPQNLCRIFSGWQPYL